MAPNDTGEVAGYKKLYQKSICHKINATLNELLINACTRNAYTNPKMLGKKNLSANNDRDIIFAPIPYIA